MKSGKDENSNNIEEVKLPSFKEAELCINQGDTLNLLVNYSSDESAQAKNKTTPVSLPKKK